MEESCTHAALGRERRAAEERVVALASELAWLAGDAGDANGDDEHDPEGSTLAFERARVSALLVDAGSHLRDLDLAASRLTTEDYAVCDRCGGVIPSERLEALPATRTCVGCAATRSG